MSDLPRLEQAIAELRREMMGRLDAVDTRIQSVTVQVVAGQTRFDDHTEVCNERQRQIARYMEEWRQWLNERSEEWRAFMTESRTDRAGIRESLQMIGWRILIAVVVANILASIATVMASRPGLFAGIH